MRYSEFRLVESRFLLLELSDAIKNKQRERFRNQKPELTDAQIDYYLDRWDQFVGGFDQQYRDITRLTFDQVEQLIDDAEVRQKIKGKSKTQQVFDKSADTIYSKNNLEILKGDTRDKCIQYGRGQGWCISDKDGLNAFSSYRKRKDEPTFYFVFDMDKPDHDHWHAVVIFVNNRGDFYVDSGEDGAEWKMTWDQIVQKQPKLRGLEELFVHQPLTPEERANYEKYGSRVNLERYKSFRLGEKLKYITFGFHDLTSEQQDATPDELIPIYAKTMPTRITKTTWNRLKSGDQRYIIKKIERENSWPTLSSFIRNVGIEPVEHIVTKDSLWAYWYARDVINQGERKGIRWPEGEPAIATHPQRAYLYARDVINQGERKGIRWREAEPAIAKDPWMAYEYARNVIGGRWREAEPAIAKDPRYKSAYERDFNVDLDKELRDK